MRRREFVAGVSVAALSPFAVHAEPGEPMRRVGILVAQVECFSG
jgi:hypothetical protein